MHLPLLFLLLYIHIVFLISVLYLSLSFHILFVYDILAQILYDICNSICYVLNFEYPFWITSLVINAVGEPAFILTKEVSFSTHSYKLFRTTGKTCGIQ